ncbi:MFS transporter [Pseudonocardia endophytica]|uniref:Putative MFS family arabinose efflux permease n=1 Tax=Pseudonocardia endophytica TaxID=401976 RepID=A0A4R1HMT7_PSEEN|nr:MFS transporter [Pseudonocardia endophytica]TCK20979.1 putative MFS family arabinose efflux permease [Pseudonocardia endophytica]
MNAVVARSTIALVQVLGLAVWFSATAVGPALRAEWHIGSTTAVWLTCSVQLGFVLGAVGAAVLTLADRVRPHRLLAIATTGASVCTLLCTVADGAAAAIPLRLLTGMFLAGVYPVGMKLMTSWSGPRRRARDLGTLVAALTLGSALPHLVLAGPPLPWRVVLAVAAGCGLLAAAVTLLVVRPGPAAAPAPPPDPRYAARMLREPGPRLVVLGYLGHMWELYALWTWLGAYLGAGGLGGRSEVLVFLTMGLGGALGCMAGGRAADRWGRAPTIAAALVVSGLCCVLSPFAVSVPPVVTGLFCLVWTTAAVADSPVLTTATIEVADPRYTGTALTVQTALGFLLTVASIQLVPVVAGVTGWASALAVLAVGPIVGTLAVVRLGRAVDRLGPPAEPVEAVDDAVGGAGGVGSGATSARHAAGRAGPAPAVVDEPVVSTAGVVTGVDPDGTGEPRRPAGGADSRRPTRDGDVLDAVTAPRGLVVAPVGAAPPRSPEELDTVELYRLRRGGAPADSGFAGDTARALQGRGRSGGEVGAGRRRPEGG